MNIAEVTMLIKAIKYANISTCVLKSILGQQSDGSSILSSQCASAAVKLMQVYHDCLCFDVSLFFLTLKSDHDLYFHSSLTNGHMAFMLEKSLTVTNTENEKDEN